MFLRGQWRPGTLPGQTGKEAFCVNCGKTTTTQDGMIHGWLMCEIGITAVQPAEFVIFRIVQHTAETGG